MKFKKKLWISLILFILFGTVFSGWIFHQNTTREYLVFDNTTQLVTTERFEDNIRIEDVILPDSFQNQQSILFKTTHTRAEVLLDGEKIYEFGNDTDTLRFMKSPGPCWHIVDLPKNSDGKHLQVRIIPVYSDYYGNSFHLFGGTKGDCTLKILSNSLCSLVLSCEILSLGIICLILCFSIMRKNDKYSSDESYMIFLNLGVFSLLITLWTLKQCGFLQFLIPDPRALYFIDYFTFFLFPVPFNFILYDICKSKYRKGAVHLSILYLCNMAAAVLLQCAGIIDIFRILPITHLIMLVNVIYTVTLIRYESIKLQNEAARHFKYPMYLVMALGAAELVAYYIRHFQQTSLFLPLGTMLFILLLVWIQVSRFYDHYLQKQKLVYLQKLADTDLLTDTMNRNAYEKKVNRLNVQKDKLHTTGLILFDLDNLKIINDRFGHEKGDEALQLCSQCIKQFFPDKENLFRIGGDEFAYFYNKNKENNIEDKIAQLNQTLESTEHTFNYPLSISSGYACFLPDLSQTGYAELIKRTDFSLTMAKQHGRNCCYIFQEEEYQNFLRIREITNELHSAVNHSFRGFSIIFQPVMDIRQDKLTGAEVLIRFASKKFGPISPAEFIPLLETSGLIIPTGRWFMREAITACRKIRMQIPDFKVNINVSQVQITKSDVITDLISEMNASGLPPAAIAIELTESILLEKNEKAQNFLKELKQAGLQLALDDFGTGYSNFHYLSELHPDIVKIDRGFTSKAITDKKEYYLLNQFSNMIHNLGLKLCIEGIETEDELQKIKLLKPDYCQGFYWGRPCSYDEFRKYFVDVDR